MICYHNTPVSRFLYRVYGLRSKPVDHGKHFQIKVFYIGFSGQAAVDHHVIALIDRTDVPYSGAESD